jgi:hypothetical protein
MKPIVEKWIRYAGKKFLTTLPFSHTEAYL